MRSDANEVHRVPEIGSLNGCLVEGDPEQQERDRKARRRALSASVLIQAALLAAVILIPLFGRTERLVFARDTYIRLPQPSPPLDPTRPHAAPPPPGHPNRGLAFTPIFRQPWSFPPHPPIIDGDPQPLGPIDVFPDPKPTDGGVGVPGGTGKDPAPPTQDDADKKPRVIHPGHLNPAVLIHRIEPLYPPLCKQLHREGRVELRALIAVDGSIQSLQVVSGDPLFYQSAIDAVRQWRYKPLSLNGRPVEIDTYITVIYTMNQLK